MQQHTGIWVIDNSAIPAILIECGYINNTTDAKMLEQHTKIELLARNILQGIAMYANNSFDTSKLFQLKNRDKDTSVPAQSMIEKNHSPLYVYKGMFISKSDIDKINPNEIETISVLKGQKAIDKYGEKGKDGVVEIAFISDNSISFTPPLIQKDSNFTDISFPGGDDAWRNYLNQNLNTNVPVNRHAPKGTYIVIVSFNVDENGKVSNVIALKDAGYGTAEEAVRVIKNGPNWIAGKIDNKPITTMEKKWISFQVD